MEQKGEPSARDIIRSVMMNLYQLWNDARVVDAIANMAFSKIAKVKAGALRFFLGVYDNKGTS